VKAPDLVSTLVAGIVGAILLYAATNTVLDAGSMESPLVVPLTGFAIGSGVQIFVRLIGVS
jgi:hypothetical protein